MKRLIVICCIICLVSSSTTAFALQKPSTIRSDDINAVTLSEKDDSSTVPRCGPNNDNIIIKILEKLLAIIPPILIAMFLLFT